MTPTAPGTEQQRGFSAEPSVEEFSNNMLQCWELFTKLSARKQAEAERAPTVEARHVEVLPPRTEPLSFLTLETVEEIVMNTNIGNLEEHETWERRMENFVNLGNAYSSENTLTGERCYMVDASLYKDILLAVAARKQNEQSLATAAEKLEQHIEQIGNSNERIMKGRKMC